MIGLIISSVSAINKISYLSCNPYQSHFNFNYFLVDLTPLHPGMVTLSSTNYSKPYMHAERGCVLRPTYYIYLSHITQFVCTMFLFALNQVSVSMLDHMSV